MDRRSDIKNQTQLIYLVNPKVRRCSAKVMDFFHDSSHASLILDQTAAYPQGGGQPGDSGVVMGHDGESFHFCRTIAHPDGTIRHIGNAAQNFFREGQLVDLDIDWERRLLHSRLHASGEIICAAINALGFKWPLTAASHFPAQARVAFQCGSEFHDLEVFRKRLIDATAQIIDARTPIYISYAQSPEELATLCPSEAKKQFALWPVRTVSVTPNFWRPCLGTHCEHTGQVGAIRFLKIRVRSEEISIGYDVDCTSFD